MTKAQTSRCSVHQGSTKMYHNLKEVYWWNDMKRNVADFGARCPNCQQVKAEHQRPGGSAQNIEILMWKWEMINMEFVVGLPHTPHKFDSIWGRWDDHLPLIEFAYNNNYHVRIQMALFEALYGRRCRSPIGWFEIGEAELIGPNLVHQDMEKVKIITERLKTAQIHQKSYLDVRRGDLEFKEDDWVFLKISPMKGVMRFGKKRKLSPRIELPPEMSLVNPMFQVSILKKVVGDPSLIIPVKTIEVNEELTYEEISVSILDRQVRKLRNKEITSVKVLWRNQQVEEATWESEEEMKKKYPHLFE
ncbi:uncharacterized protein [Nicotiana tomentosiformis]|uniref:uncharacterized protein n=1 Tax=Nicotiana tomentosiformis TaxID=4098 RepID=UPI00388C7654